MNTVSSVNKPRKSNLGRFAATTALLLTIPLIAMQFRDDVVWTLGDFVVAGLLLFGTGAIYELATRNVESRTSRVCIGAAFLILLFLVWAALATD